MLVAYLFIKFHIFILSYFILIEFSGRKYILDKSNAPEAILNSVLKG
jgi:hypothetical protein